MIPFFFSAKKVPFIPSSFPALKRTFASPFIWGNENRVDLDSLNQSNWASFSVLNILFFCTGLSFLCAVTPFQALSILCAFFFFKLFKQAIIIQMAVISILCSRLIHGGQLLNGLAGPTVMNAAPFLSTTWFSPDERATATAIASLLNYLGAAGAFLVGPLVVPSPNGTSHHLLVSQSNTEHIKDRIEAVLYAGVFKKKVNYKTFTYLYVWYLWSTTL